ncbi:MAG: HAD hydrolase-like protein [Actinomycetia bacterium]|nr:HAD hydrolase-like protein [Actinomycetes bacterium]
MTSPSAAPQAILLDLDGTVRAAGRALPGAANALAELRARGLKLRLLTNADHDSVPHIVADLAAIGLQVDPSEVFTPCLAARQLLNRTPGARALALVSNELRPLFPDPGAVAPTHVLVADGRDWLSYPALDRAFRALRSGAELLASQRGRYFTLADGDHLDTGAVVAALEHAAGKPARVLGKPAVDFFALALADLAAAADECLVVGDDATTDVAGARAAGIRSAQVRTGLYADQRREGLTGAADHTIDSIADLPHLLDTLAGA